MPYVERGVPCFDGTFSEYKDYRCRAKLYITRRKIEKKENEALVQLLSGLTKEAWDCCESLNMDDLEKATELVKFWEIMDRNFKYDERTEVPNLFEELFTHMWRQKDQNLMEYVTLVEKKFRKLKEVEITLPSLLEGWLLMRRSGATKEQRALVLSTVGL